MKEELRTFLVETGEIEKLKNLLKERLIESGWRDEMKAICKAKVKDRGANQITVEELVQEITSTGRQKVPDPVKKELLINISAVLHSTKLDDNNK